MRPLEISDSKYPDLQKLRSSTEVVEVSQARPRLLMEEAVGAFDSVIWVLHHSRHCIRGWIVQPLRHSILESITAWWGTEFMTTPIWATVPLGHGIHSHVVVIITAARMIYLLDSPVRTIRISIGRLSSHNGRTARATGHQTNHQGGCYHLDRHQTHVPPP